MKRFLSAEDAKEFKSALAFLTSLPIDATAPSPATLKMFPAVGALLGISEGLLYKLVKKVSPAYMAAAVTVMSDLVFTSGMHLDGLADSADALLAHVPKNSRLSIMEEPALGVYGVSAIVMSLILKTLALFGDESALVDFVLPMVFSRTIAKAIIEKSTYAKGDGLALKFQENSNDHSDLTPANAPDMTSLETAMIAILLLMSLLASKRKKVLTKRIFSLFAALGPVLFIHKTAKNKLNGYTGDTIGASITCYEVSYWLFRNIGSMADARRQS